MLWADLPRALTLVTAPTAEPISYAQAKAFFRLPDDTEESLVVGLITTARMKVEADTGLMLATQTWDLSFDAFPEDAIRPPCCPLQSVTSIKTTTPANVESTVGATNYQLDVVSYPPRIVLSASGAWPTDLRTTAAITVRCVAGYASAQVVPGPLLRAMEQILAIYYMQRASTALVLPPRWLGYDALIAPYRLQGGF
jgi:uncharacterized phiE125 gp8 family phage protein